MHCGRILFFVIFLIVGLPAIKAQSSLKKQILGHWENCGYYDKKAKTIVLFRAVKGNCEGDCCDIMYWDFEATMLDIDLSMKCPEGGSPKICMTAPFKDIKWAVDEKNKSLSIEGNRVKALYKIVKLDKNKLELTKIE